MKPKTLILMAVAIVCGLGAAYMTSNLLAQRQVTKTDELEKVFVLVAKKDLEIGINIKDKNAKHLFEKKEFIKGKEPKGAITSYKELYNKFLSRHLRKGDFVRPNDLVTDFQNLKLPGGKRAVGLRVNDETSVAGFATLPGNHVDILWFIRDGSGGGQCLTLLEDVLVLAADTISTRKDDRNAIPARVVTVALTPEEARDVYLAQKKGELKLILRRPDDSTTVKDSQTTYRELLKKVLKEKEDPKPEPPPVVVQEPKAVEQPKEEVKPQPVFRQHLVDIVESGRTRTQQFLVDEAGNIVRPGTSGTGLNGVAPLLAPPAPQQDGRRPLTPPRLDAHENPAPPAQGLKGTF